MGYAGNGNVQTANDSENGNWTYGYDTVNRLQTALVSGQNCTYYPDQYGNMYCTNTGNLPCTPVRGTPPNLNLSFDTTTNRISDGGIHQYDAAGNMTADGTHGYVYDLENRITCVLGTDGTCTSTSAMLYFYDPQGQRVGKLQANTLGNYVYDPQGHIISVHDGSANLLRRELYPPEGRHVATWDNNSNNNGLFWNHADWLGTERVRTNLTGIIAERCTDTPYGMNLACTTPPPDISPIHFTGKQRDTESGNDYFGARYYGSAMGRWMSPDWNEYPATVPYADFANPQTLNLYGYLSNNPLSRTDPTGHDGNWISLGGKNMMRNDTSSHDQVNVHVKTKNGDFRGKLDPVKRKINWYEKGAPPNDIVKDAQSILLERGKYDIAAAKKEMSILGGTRKGKDEEESGGALNSFMFLQTIIDVVADEVQKARINKLEGTAGFHIGLAGSIIVTDLAKFGEIIGTGAQVSFDGDTFTLQGDGTWTDSSGHQLNQDATGFHIACPACSNLGEGLYGIFKPFYQN